MDRTPLQTTETLRKCTDLLNLTQRICGHIPEAEKNVSGDLSTQCRGGCLESKHVAVNRLISSSVTSSAEGWSAKRSTDSSEASDAALDKSPRLCLGLERCKACRSASPFSKDDIPDTPRIFDDNGRTCCRDSGIVFMTCEPCCRETGRADQGRAAFFLGPLRCVGDSEPFSSFLISASRWAFCSPEAVAHSLLSSFSSISRWSKGKLRPCGTGSWWLLSSVSSTRVWPFSSPRFMVLAPMAAHFVPAFRGHRWWLAVDWSRRRPRRKPCS
mmetsp:Transcript_28/g.69  ORF Transcript_28/g.69 Transcript_28/m.69 type:complete len:271 (+) Transcript_28:317-1129(+)